MLTENAIIDRLVDFFRERNYEIVRQRSTKEKGIDLEVRDSNGLLHLIEAKGGTSGREGSKRFGIEFSGNQIWTHVGVGLLKTLKDINEHQNTSSKFGLAFPENHRTLLSSIKSSLDKLGITVYLVSESEVNIL